MLEDTKLISVNCGIRMLPWQKAHHLYDDGYKIINSVMSYDRIFAVDLMEFYIIWLKFENGNDILS